MIRLYHAPSTACMAPHILLEELGIPFELAPVDKDGGELDTPAYRKLNPNGLMPVLVQGELVLFETAAICQHLAETHPEGQLMPLPGSQERAHFLKWLSWLSTTLQQALILYFYPHRWADTPEAAAQVKRHAQARVMTLLEQLEAQLASHGQPWLLGERYSLLDPYALMLCRWTRNFEGSKARDFAHIGPWLQRVLARPAVQRVFTREQLAQPWV